LTKGHREFSVYRRACRELIKTPSGSHRLNRMELYDFPTERFQFLIGGGFFRNKSVYPSTILHKALHNLDKTDPDIQDAGNSRKTRAQTTSPKN
jgi:hypothetical protein